MRSKKKENIKNKNMENDTSKVLSENKETNNGDILTIPNLISFFRIIIITPFVYYFLIDNYIAAAAVLLLSGLSDCVDGYIARKFNQVSDLGKILDPIADKLTLLAVGVCICIMVPYVLPVMMILIIKDILMLIGASVLFKEGKMPPAAKWYGKIGTVLFYFSVIIIVFLKAAFNYENVILSTVLLAVTAVVMIFALIKYFIIFVNLLKDSKENSQKEKKD